MFNFKVEKPDIDFNGNLSHLNGKFIIGFEDQELYLWHDGTVHGGPDEKEFPNDGCIPFSVDPSSQEVYKYGWYQTKEEAQVVLDKYNEKYKEN